MGPNPNGPLTGSYDRAMGNTQVFPGSVFSCVQHWRFLGKVLGLLENKKDTVGGRNPANHLTCMQPCKEWDKLPTSTGENFFH